MSEYIVGAVVQLRDLLTDPNNANAPVTGATVSCTVYLPTNPATTQDLSVAEAVSGDYRALFDATVAGNHEYVFSVPPGQSGQGADRGTFYVAPVP